MDNKKKELIKNLDYFTYIKGRREAFQDAIEYDALKIATAVDPHQVAERKERMEEILCGYSEKDQPKFFQVADGVFGILQGMLDDFGDHMGEVFMELEGNKKEKGQFFTPYCVSKLIAEITLEQLPQDEKVVTICEPTSGAGGMIVAVAEVFNEKGFNYTDKALVVANDIDRNCVFMSYLQISFTGMPAVVKHQDTITQKTWDAFITPAFALQYSKFKRVYENLSGQSEM